MALARCAWGFCSLQNQTQQLPFVNASMRVVRLQVSCKAYGTYGSSNSSSKKKTSAVQKKGADQKKQVKKTKKEQLEDFEDVVDDDYIDESEWTVKKPVGFGTKPVDPLEIERQKEFREAARERQKIRKAERKTNYLRDDVRYEKKEPKPLPRIVLDGDEVVEKKKKKPVPVNPPPVPEPAGFKIKVIHLPKKKNIARDLRKAFRDVQGLLYIKPNESGKKDTRDFVCKGSAMLTFADKQKADIFIKRFASEKIRFGNVLKTLTYELLGYAKAEVRKTTGGPVLQLRDDEPVTANSQPENKVSKVTSKNKDEKTEEEDDVVIDAIIDTIMEDGSGDEELETDDEDEEEEFESEEDEEELLEIEKGSGGQRGRLSNELEYEDSEAEYSDGSEEFSDDDESYEDDEEADEEISNAKGGIVVHDDLKADKQGRVDIDVDASMPFSIRDLGGEDPREVIRINTKKMEELDEKIKELTKQKASKADLKMEIRKLREMKVELLEKRVIARMVVAREAAKAKRRERQELEVSS